MAAECFRRRFFAVAIVVFSVVTITNSALPKRLRSCCRYANVTSGVDEDSPNLAGGNCPDRRSCLVIMSSQQRDSFSPILDRCSVIKDTKRDREAGCLDEAYEATSDKKVTEFVVRAYSLDHDGTIKADSIDILGLEVAVPYSTEFDRLRFRLANAEPCPADETCTPRCVSIERNGSPSKPGSAEELVYDCELGLLTTGRGTNLSRMTLGSTYNLDICLGHERCSAYLLQLPGTDDAAAMRQDQLVLMDKADLYEEGRLTLLFPAALAGPGYETRVKIAAGERNITDFAFQRTSPADSPERPEPSRLYHVFSHEVGYRLEPNTLYQVSYEDGNRWITVARFRTKPLNRAVHTLSLLVGAFLVLAVACAIVYRRYLRVRKQNRVEPNRLLEAGRISPRSVLIISNVDDRHHIDVVHAISKYLKAHCAVGEVYFALDPTTGLRSQGEQDPWKWAQSTMETIAENEGGFLLFIAGPPTDMGITIYKELHNNQAYVSTAHLKAMSDKNRLAVLRLPYSDMETVPSVLPLHVRNSAYNFPSEANSFLCQLLDIKKRDLCSFLPLPIVMPQVLPSNLSLYEGGEKLTGDIFKLQEKVEKFVADQKLRESKISPRDEISDYSEEKVLLRTGRGEDNCGDAEEPTKKPNGLALKVEVEAGIVGLKDKEFAERDRRTNPELVDENVVV